MGRATAFFNLLSIAQICLGARSVSIVWCTLAPLRVPITVHHHLLRVLPRLLAVELRRVAVAGTGVHVRIHHVGWLLGHVLRLILLLRALDDELEHLELVLLHGSHMLHLLLVDALRLL